MKRVLLALTATVAVLAIGMAAVAVAHTIRFESTTTLKYKKNGNKPDSFEGTVSSTRPGCVKNRSVKVRRKIDGPDPLAGATTTADDGAWEIKLAGKADAGDYYAAAARKVLRKSAKHKHVCKLSRSKHATVH